MQGNTQANHLAKRISQYTHYPKYELTLPFVTLDLTYLEELEKDDVVLLKQKVLSFLLLKDDIVVAKGVLKEHNALFICKITELLEECLPLDVVKISLGKISSKALDIGLNIDILSIDFEKVTLHYQGKKLAKASLINVEDNIALKIQKVKR